MAMHSNNWLLVPSILTAIKTILSLFLETMSLLLFLPLLIKPEIKTPGGCRINLSFIGQNNLALFSPYPQFVSPPSKLKALHLIELTLFISNMAPGELGSPPCHSTVSSRISAQCIYLCPQQVYKTYLLNN